MMLAIAAIVASVLIALDAVGNWRRGVAKTTVGTYSRAERPTGFRVVCAVKLLMSFVLLVLASMLIAWNAQ